jgi:hypothetical protein
MVSNPKAFYFGRVNITRLVRYSVMPPMMSNPPQGSTLRCAGTKPGSRELDNSACLECVMAEFSMVKAGNSEASHYVHHG